MARKPTFIGWGDAAQEKSMPEAIALWGKAFAQCRRCGAVFTTNTYVSKLEMDRCDEKEIEQVKQARIQMARWFVQRELDGHKGRCSTWNIVHPLSKNPTARVGKTDN